MVLTNKQIYNYAYNLIAHPITQSLPVKINFFLQKNIKLIMEAAKEIEEARNAIGEHFGTLNPETKEYLVNGEQQQLAQQELYDLFNITQEINIHKFSLSDFENISLTYREMNAIMFMIEE